MQKPFSSRYVTALSILSCMALLQACSAGKNYSEINPEDAQRQVRESNGYKELKKPIPAGKSRLVLRSAGAGMPVKFSVCDPSAPCREWSVADSGQGVLYPKIARMVARANRAVGGTLPYAPPLVDAGKTVDISAFSDWATSNSHSGGQCGPLNFRFVPEEKHAYTVEFRWEASICRLLVHDATDPDAPVSLMETKGDIQADSASQ